MKKLQSQILAILEEDCRYTPAKIAVMLEKTEQEIVDAIEEMEKSGVIEEYTTIVNPQKISGAISAEIERIRCDRRRDLSLRRGEELLPDERRL